MCMTLVDLKYPVFPREMHMVILAISIGFPQGKKRTKIPLYHSFNV